MRSALKKYKPRLGLILLIYVAFIALGMPDGLLGVAWPSVRASFGLPIDALGMLLFASMAGYLTSSFSSGHLIPRFGVGRVLAASCTATGVALIGYTLVPQWGMIVALGILAGLGAGAIDAGLNTYVAAHYGEGLMQWLHASYGIGITLGPIIMTLGLKYFDTWRFGYAVVGTVQLALALCFVLTLPMWQDHAHAAAPGEPRRLTDYKTPWLETLRRPQVWLSLLLFFLYTGVEVTLGAWTYSLLTESRGISPQTAGLVAGGYWATFTLGRIVAGLYAGRVGVNALVRGGMLVAFAGTILLWQNPINGSSVLAVAIIGFAIAPIFPAMVSGTSARVGRRYAANTIGMQMGAASLGAAGVPSFVGVLARHTSLEIVPPFLVLALAVLFGLYMLATAPARPANPPDGVPQTS
jgi:fucose permease